MNPAPDERDRIRAAMDRILSGTAERSNGGLTIVALALEAEVPRNALTQRHTDLKAEFYARVAERGAPSEVETRLRATITALNKTIANKNAELAQLRADVPALVRAVNQLTLENQELREALASPSAEVIPIRRRWLRHALAVYLSARRTAINLTTARLPDRFCALPSVLDFRGLGGEGHCVFPGQSEDAEFCGCWLVRVRWLKSGGDDDAAELGGRRMSGARWRTG